jgi:hypothetical protein
LPSTGVTVIFRFWNTVSFPLAQPSEMRRITRLVVLGPELRPLGAALLGVWACACRPALGAGGVVLLVGPVGGGPGFRSGGSAHPLPASTLQTELGA